jgi:outer membrane murein-binding lipoprotein Lpp
VRFTIDEYAKTFKMSKEMIHNKLRTKRLNYIIEGGVTYIIVPRSSLDEEKRIEITQKNDVPATAPQTPKTTVGMIISLYQKENQQLKLKIKELEAKVDRLVNDKEQMLIAERQRVEDIYTAKDEQLKSILEVINTKLLLSHDNIVHDVDVTDRAPEPFSPANGTIELKRYLKFIGMNSEERKQVRRRFEVAYGSDQRVIQKDGEFYVDLSKYDYTDFLS